VDGFINNKTVTTGNSQSFQEFCTLTTSNITIQTGATAELKARYEVNLQPGFDANNGSEVHIYCSPIFADCNDLSGFQMQKTINPVVENTLNIESAKDIELSFKKHISQNTINVSPNPSNGLFIIQLKSNDGNSTLKLITVFDITGRKILTVEADTKSYMLDLSEQPKGIYFLHANDMNNDYNEKIIIN
jgi:hypothetical protein